MSWLDAPTLTGEHVVLRALRRHDAAGLLAAADDDAVFARWHTVARPQNLDDATRLVERYLTNAGTVTWAQVVDGEVAGVTTYYDVDPPLRSLAIGSTWLGRRWHRTAVNTEAKLALVSRAFDTLGAVRVVWHTDVLNVQSQRAIERLGAQREGLLRKHKLRRDGTWRDTVQYAMTDDDWPAAREGLQARLHRA